MSLTQIIAPTYITIPGCGICLCQKPRLWHLFITLTQAIICHVISPVCVSTMSQAQANGTVCVTSPGFDICLHHKTSLMYLLISQSTVPTCVTNPDCRICLCHKPRLWNLYMSQAKAMVSAYVISPGYCFCQVISQG